MKAILASALASIALVAGYVALGGGDFEPAKPPPACSARAQDASGGVTGTLQRVALNALAGSACELGVSRERLLLSLSGEGEIDVDDERRTAAFRRGLNQALDAEQQAGRIGASEALVLRGAIEFLPVDAILDRLFGDAG